MSTRSCQQGDTAQDADQNQNTAQRLQAQHIQLSKRAWRRWAKATRTRLPLETYSQKLGEVLATAAPTCDAEHILAYLPTAHELDITPLLRTWQQQGKQVYVTRTWPDNYHLSVHVLEPDMLELHRYGYWQPREHAHPIDPSCLELALVPGLCFDNHGQRLGYGAGYFDRLLALCHATTVGITCQALVIQHVPHEKTDITMDYLATEQGIRRCF